MRHAREAVRGAGLLVVVQDACPPPSFGNAASGHNAIRAMNWERVSVVESVAELARFSHLLDQTNLQVASPILDLSKRPFEFVVVYKLA
jgi:hypothetical protein